MIVGLIGEVEGYGMGVVMWRRGHGRGSRASGDGICGRLGMVNVGLTNGLNKTGD